MTGRRRPRARTLKHASSRHAVTPTEMLTYLYGELTRGQHETCPHCHGQLGTRRDLFRQYGRRSRGTKDAEGRVTRWPPGRLRGSARSRPAPSACRSSSATAACSTSIRRIARAARSSRRRVREGVWPLAPRVPRRRGSQDRARAVRARGARSCRARMGRDSGRALASNPM